MSQKNKDRRRKHQWIDRSIDGKNAPTDLERALLVRVHYRLPPCLLAVALALALGIGGGIRLRFRLGLHGAGAWRRSVVI